MIVGKRDGRTDGSYCAAQTVKHKFVRGCGLACLTDMSHCARRPAPCTAPAASARYCVRSEVQPLYSPTLSRVTSFDGSSSTVDAGFWPLRIPTPTCTARRAMKNGSCEAEAWTCAACGSLRAASM